MFLLSPIILKLLKRSIEYAHVFRIMPFEWDTKRDLIKYASNRNLLGWKFVKTIFHIQTGFIIIRFTQSALEVNLKNFTEFVFEAFLMAVFTFISILQLSLMHKGRDIGICLNRFLVYYRRIQGTEPETPSVYNNNS